jgi:hypothetical protein
MSQRKQFRTTLNFDSTFFKYQMSDYSDPSNSEDESPTPSDIEFTEQDCGTEDSDFVPDSQPDFSEDFTEDQSDDS